MRRRCGLFLGGVLAAACGHAQTTGTAQNDWTTPTGYAQATQQRVYRPDMAAHAARDRSAFRAQAPSLQAPAPDVTTPPPAALPPVDEGSPSTLPPSGPMPPDAPYGVP